MPKLPVDELLKVTPRWPLNSRNIYAPEHVCGHYDCVCADWARENMTDGEYQLAFGVPKEFGMDPDERDAYHSSAGTTTVTISEGWALLSA